MSTTFTGQPIAGTYGDVLQLGNAGAGLTGLLNVCDGFGNASALSISGNYVYNGNITFNNSTISLVAGTTLNITPNTVFAGDVTVAGNINAGSIDVNPNSITLADLQQIPANSFLANITGGTADITAQTLLPSTMGGTGVSNASTITIGGALVTANAFATAGNFATTLTSTGTTNVTLPLTGTLSTLAGTETLTNKTLTTSTLTTPVINGTITGTTIIPIANGGTGVAVSDPIVQRVYTETGAVNAGNSLIPFDDTIPQKTEGDQYMTLAITPKAATNKLIINITLNLSNNVAGGNAIVAAVFQDSGTDALAAAVANIPVNTAITQLKMTHTISSTLVPNVATTFKIRAGGIAASQTTLNGVSGGRLFGGVLISSIEVIEIVN